jgi:two-component system alkaline phosphatase synthesis response regulator PhoP
MTAAKILVVDDEPGIVELVLAYLRADGYEVLSATNGPSGLKIALENRPDLIVLDVMLPGMDGIELLTQLRRESNVYVILLTAKSDETDKIIGLSVGADDYVTKPFSPRELVARIKAAIRRLSKVEEQPGQLLIFEGVRIDLGGRRVWVESNEIELTTTEFDLLAALASHRGMVLSREQLLEKVWGYDYYGDTRVVDVHLGHIRKKLGDESLISTIRGVGYRFEDRKA